MLTTIELRKRYVLYVRGILSAAIILVGMYNYTTVTISPVITYAFIALLVASNIVFMLIPAVKYRGLKLHYLVFILDMAFIVIGAYIFTHLDLQFIIAVFLTIFMAAMSQSVGFSILIAVVVNALYIYIKIMMGHSVLSDSTLLNMPFMFVVALHGSYIAEKANEDIREKQQLEKMNVLLTKRATSKTKEVSEIVDFTENLCDSFKQAVIVLDEDGFVRMFNKAAEKIFSINRERTMNKPVKELTALGEVKDAFMALKLGHEEYTAKEIKLGSSGARLRVWTSYVSDKAENPIGILCCAEKMDI